MACSIVEVSSSAEELYELVQLSEVPIDKELFKVVSNYRCRLYSTRNMLYFIDSRPFTIERCTQCYSTSTQISEVRAETSALSKFSLHAYSLINVVFSLLRSATESQSPSLSSSQQHSPETSSTHSS